MDLKDLNEGSDIGNRKKTISAEIFVNEESACRKEKLKGRLGHSLRQSSVLASNLCNVILRLGDYCKG